MKTRRKEVYDELPSLLKKVCGHGVRDEERDLLLLGGMTAVSAVMPNIVGEYGDARVYANLYLYVTAQASAGKGRLGLCRRLVGPIHEGLITVYKKEMAAWEAARAEYLLNKKEHDKPIEPAKRMLLIPGNSSATSVFQILSENDGVGLIFETEGDTLAKTFRSGCGDYSDGFRKAFHHERISYMRRKDKEHVDLEAPRLSVLLTGTPQQVLSLIPDAENGLFSRCMYYYMDIKMDWNNVFIRRERSLDMVFDDYGKAYYDFYKLLKKEKERHFVLTDEQQKVFNARFGEWQEEYKDVCGVGFVATVRRMGLICYRITMILTTLRLMDSEGNWPEELVCSDVDFENAMYIADALLEHAEVVYKMLPKSKIASGTVKSAREKREQEMLERLEDRFNTDDLLVCGKEMGIPKSTLFRRVKELIDNGLVEKMGHGIYKKKKSENLRI